MTRLDAIESLTTDPFYGPLVSRLRATEIVSMLLWLRQNAHLDKDAFALAVSRMHLDVERPKNWALIEEVLHVANNKAAR